MSLQSTENWFQSGGGNFYDYPIENSLVLNDASSQYLSRTGSSTSSTYTLSMWFKRSTITSSNYQYLFSNATNGGISIGSTAGNVDQLYIYAAGQGNVQYISSRLYRDTSAWYHLVVKVSSNSATVYINGEQEGTATMGSLSTSTNAIQIGQYAGGGSFHFDGQIADVHLVVGQALNPTSFGETKTGVWKPKAYSGSHGTGGFHLKFEGNANDSSGNGNNFTTNGTINSWQYLNDGPTLNYCKFAQTNIYDVSGSYAFEYGDLTTKGWGNPAPGFYASMGMKTGKWYWEFRSNYSYVDGMNSHVGIIANGWRSTATTGKSYGVYGYLGTKDSPMSWPGSAHFGASFANGDIYMFAFDADNGKIWFGKNGSWYNNGSTDGSANPATGTNPAFSNIDTDSYTFLPYIKFYDAYSSRPNLTWNFGNNSTFCNTHWAGSNTDESTLGLFQYSVPSGFNCLCASNLPVANSINPAEDSSPQDYFTAITYTANNSSTKTLNGFGFAPDLFIAKMRTTNQSSYVGDTVRGDDEFLQTDSTGARTTATNWITFGSDGVTLNNVYANTSTYDYGAWAWQAGGNTVSNTDGSQTVSVRANPDVGFSIIKYTGTQQTNAPTFGHGLGAEPDLIIVKGITEAQGWYVMGKAIGDTSGGGDFLYLNSSGSYVNNSASNNVTWNSSTIGLDYNSGINASGDTFICYAFRSIPGFSSFGVYEGNSSANGIFVYTGFKPKFVMFKAINSAQNWFIHDTARSPYNVSTKVLLPNRGDLAELTASNWYIDILSNGFKQRNSDIQANNSSYDYLYIAFAENPFAYANAH